LDGVTLAGPQLPPPMKTAEQAPVDYPIDLAPMEVPPEHGYQDQGEKSDQTAPVGEEIFTRIGDRGGTVLDVRKPVHRPSFLADPASFVKEIDA